jgi:predicted metalloprotease
VLEPEGSVGKADGRCPFVPARIAPTAAPPYSCTPVDPITQQLFADVNQFWSSNVTVCACGPDFPEGCAGGFSLFEHGYVWVGTEFARWLVDQTQSLMSLRMLLSHEFGHELQGHYNGFAPTVLQRELSADCLSGYYVGSLACRGIASERDIMGTLALACQLGDGTGDPIADRDSHGTCDQRRDAVARGIDAYYQNMPPLHACSY